VDSHAETNCSEPGSDVYSEEHGLLTFAVGSGINPSTKTLSISAGQVPLGALQPTHQELICAHGVGDLVMNTTEVQQQRALQEVVGDYGLRDVEGRVATFINVDDDLNTFANHIRDWVQNLQHSVVFKISTSHKKHPT
jgi:hypothetical protein